MTLTDSLETGHGVRGTKYGDVHAKGIRLKKVDTTD